MKIMREHDGANYSKEQDSVEKYLMKLIHRYFLIENDYSERQEEAIIIEAIRRVKEYLADHDPYIFALNGRNGLVNLRPEDIGGEAAFEKNTAFNKDFGTNEDTICEGNDERLSNAREPLYHTHYIDEFDGLNELLYEREVHCKRKGHTHDNLDALNVIEYTGSKEQYDLILLENCLAFVELYLERLDFIKDQFDDFIATIRNRIGDIQTTVNTILNDLEEAKNGANWLEKAKIYDNENANRIRSYMKQKLGSLISLEELNVISSKIILKEIITDELDFNPVESTDIIKTHEFFNFNPEEEIVIVST